MITNAVMKPARPTMGERGHSSGFRVESNSPGALRARPVDGVDPAPAAGGLTELAPADAAGRSIPLLKLHGFRLDYAAALRALGAGQSRAEIALAAGSKARDRAGLRRVGTKIVHNLDRRGVVAETFDRLGYSIETFCRGVIEGPAAEKTTRLIARGRVVETFRDPDWSARSAARDQYIRAVGLERLPLGDSQPADDLPSWAAALLARRPAADWAALAELSAAELAGVFAALPLPLPRNSRKRA